MKITLQRKSVPDSSFLEFQEKGRVINSKLPYYVGYGDQELMHIMSAIGVLDNDERAIFSQICQYAKTNNTPYVELEDLVIEIVKWAERHNFAALRLTQTAKKIASLLIETLQKFKFCEVKSEDGEIAGFTLYEPEFEQINAKYKRIMDHDITLPFPQEKDLSIPPLPDMVLEIPEADINMATVEEVISRGKIGKIIFNEIESHVLVTPKVFTQLPNLCLRKIYKFLKTPGNLKNVDFIIKTLEILMPDRTYDTEKIMRILSLEEKDSPEFFIHFTDNLIQKLTVEKNIGDIQPVYQASVILKRFKMEQMEQALEEEKEHDKKEDLHRILGVLQKNHRSYLRQELYAFFDDPVILRLLSGKYERNEFVDMIDIFLEQFTRSGKNENTGTLPYPTVFRIFDTGHEIYIHNDHLIPLLERERIHATEQLKKHYLEKWMKALRSYASYPEMSRDKAFEEEIARALRKRFPILESILRDSESLYNLFITKKDDPDLFSRMKFYFAKPNKNVLKRFADILGLDRTQLNREAYAALPFVYRNVITRFILYIINIFSGGKKKAEKENEKEKSEEEAESMAGEEEPASEEASRKEAKTKIRKFLVDIEKNYRTGGNVSEILEGLHERWNEKIGDVRNILREKVDKDIQEKAMAIFRIMLKSPNFSEQWLHKELRNMANTLSAHKYSDITDKKSLAMYIIIFSIWTIRQKVR